MQHHYYYHYHLCSIINNAVMDNGHTELLIVVDQYNYPVSIITRISARRRRISMDKVKQGESE